jgi:hypothetical protein
MEVRAVEIKVMLEIYRQKFPALCDEKGLVFSFINLPLGGSRV